ncbi:putative lipid II flippase FtsW [Candidatus Acetothermia bacterium]|nr:MAG: putative lipid II flippase FtsW [Candidatus Acetothermia bacterium]HHK67303.1 putative lipid II flippase FtsW [Candidatus Acetothermia bacterium]
MTVEGGEGVEGGLDLKALLVTVFLLFCGLLVLYSASAPFSIRHYGSDGYMLMKQLLAAGFGVAVLAFFALFDYHRLAAINNVFMIGAFGLTVLTILPLGIGEGRWLFIGPFAVQPTEFLKFSLIVYLASALDRKGEAVRSFSEGILPFVVVLGLIGPVVLSQPDLGMFLVYGGVTGALLFLAGARLRHLAAVGAAGLPFVFLAIRLAPYRFARIVSFFNPGAYSTSSGYQTIQSLIAIGSGGVFGRGLGASRAKLFYLPQAHNDFIFSVAAEELGLLGAVLILGLVALLVWRAFVISERAADRLGRLLALGIGFTIAFQTILNTGVAVGLLPVTGLTFPFFSNGGSSLLVTLAMIGVLLNVSRQGVRG